NRMGYTADQIVLYGVSLGAAVATYVSTKREAAGLILQSGFSSLRKIAGETVPFLKTYPSWLFPSPSLNTAEILAKPHVPLLLLHGGEDSVVSIEHYKEIYKRAAGPKYGVVCRHSGHAAIAPGDMGRFQSNIRWFLEGLK